jgi:cytochrome c biogenesis protein CcmG/thiol:disulfide interchange protein DsbE
MAVDHAQPARSWPRGALWRRLRWIVVPIVVVPLTAVLFVGFGRDPSVIPSPLIGKPMPSFTLTALDGHMVSSADLTGKPVIVNFWASWCAPCVQEHPVLLDAARRYGNRVAIVGILYDDTAQGAAGFLGRYGEGGWADLSDPDGSTAVSFGVTGPPETFFIDAAGVVRGKQFGPVTSDVVTAQLAALGVAATP